MGWDVQTDDTTQRDDKRNGLRLPRRWIAGLGAAALLFAAYLVFGFQFVPGLIRTQAMAWVKTNLDQTLALGEIRFNPLTFTVEVDEIALPATDPMVALGHLRVNFSILSLFQEAWRFDEVVLDKPFVRAVVQPDHSLNLIALMPKKKSEGPSPVVRIGTLAVTGGMVAYADHSRTLKPEKRLSPISFTLKDFQTNTIKGGDFDLNATSERGEGFAWKGSVSIAPIASRGVLTVTGLSSDTVQKFFSDEMPVVLTAGAASFRADYDFAFGDKGPRLTARLPQFALRGLALDGKPALFRGSVKLDRLDVQAGPIALTAANGGIASLMASMAKLDMQGLQVSGRGVPAQSLARLTLSDARLDYGARRLSLGGLALEGADLQVRRAAGGAISLMSLLPPRPASAPPVPAPPQQPWNVTLGDVAVTKASLRFEDQAVSPMARFVIAPLNVMATGAGSDMTQPVTLRFDAQVNGAALQGEGTLTPGDKAGDIRFTLARLPLTDLVAYMPQHAVLALRSGFAGASGSVQFQGADMKALRFAGEASIDRFDLQEKSTGTPLFAWQSLTLNRISFGADKLSIGRARLARPVGQVAVLADRSFNFTALTAQGAKPAAPATTDAPPPAPPPAPVVAAPLAAAAKPAIAFSLQRLDIVRGSMGFADYSITPNFAARIDEMQGSVTNISNTPGAIAAIDLSGQVIDRFSPATIKGSMDLFGYDRKTDMQVNFRNIELPVFNPYSGRYAGYAIAKGKLSTEFSYKIDNRVLKADHHVVIDQLEWGAETDSKERVPLPVRLATALLKDRHGVIDLKLPVNGTLDDPKFRIGPIIWQIIGNIIEKVVTAPFALIGSLFEGAEKAQYVDFAPGSAVMPEGANGSLAALAKALAEKPELNLDIPAGPAIREDAWGLADAQIDAQMMARELKRGEKADVAALDMDDQHDRLEDVYRAKLGKRPEFPAFTPEQLKAASDKPDLDDDDRSEILETRWLRDRLREAYAPTTAQLAALGTQRATAVRDALLAGGAIDPARVFMAGGTSVSATEGHARLELKLR